MSWNARALVLVVTCGTLVTGSATFSAGANAQAAPKVQAAPVRPIGRLSPPSGSWFGALVDPRPFVPGDNSFPADVTPLETTIGRKLDIINHFYSYKQPIQGTAEAWDLAGGRMPLVTWGASDTLAINNGSQDVWIKKQATTLKNLNQPVFLRFYHEFDGDYRKNIVHSPADFIAAWKHTHDLFQQVGATNVVWVWCPTAWKFRTTDTPQAPAFYPGAAYVDWIASTGFNWAPAKPGTKWVNFQTVFGKFYAWAATQNKPIMLAEYGVQEDPGAAPGRKAAWISDAAATLKTTLPLVQAVMYWDSTNDKSAIYYDWRIRSSSSSINAWTTMAHDPYFNPANR